MILEEARRKKNWSQKNLAARAGIHQPTLSLIENGQASPQAETRKDLERALGVRINWLATKGLRAYRQGQMSTWEAVEQSYRKALYGINSLQKDERIEFLKLARRYLKEFEEELKAAPR